MLVIQSNNDGQEQEPLLPPNEPGKTSKTSSSSSSSSSAAAAASAASQAHQLRHRHPSHTKTPDQQPSKLPSDDPTFTVTSHHSNPILISSTEHTTTNDSSSGRNLSSLDTIPTHHSSNSSTIQRKSSSSSSSSAADSIIIKPTQDQRPIQSNNQESPSQTDQDPQTSDSTLYNPNDTDTNHTTHAQDPRPKNEQEKEGERGEEEDQVSEEEPLCRICLSGRDDEDPSLGRFIQPCLCRGTMAFIHVGCLQRWRTTSPSPKSFYRCDQCGYRYKLRRAKVAGLAENKFILGGLTFMIFFILVILSGFIAGWLLESYSQLTALDGTWDQPLGPFSYDSTGKIVGEVVGEAVRVLNSKLHVEDKPIHLRSTRSSGSSSTAFRRSESSLTINRKINNEVLSKLQAVKDDKGQEEEDSSENSYRYVRTKRVKQPDQPQVLKTSHPPFSIDRHSKHNPVSTSKRPLNDESLTVENSKGPSIESQERVENEPRAIDSEVEGEEWADVIESSILGSFYTKLEVLIKHTIKGLAFIGVMSFFQLAMSVTLFSPWNFGIRNSVLRMIRTGTTTGGGGGTGPNPLGGSPNPRINLGSNSRINHNNNYHFNSEDPNGFSSILILIFVLLGVLKAIQSVWKFVRKSSQWALRKIEDGVIDVRT